ncbi:dual specificity protein phosphatase 12-like [Bufo bufo]|uniref:dual specificity protein phosphatase 12-like n=1 Tax=Bufo bufo TaxID=8384 RepID=UPI001ABE97A1|nr:dual specificity protein phosphatase 12-like [Bufo bufo]
MICVLPGLYVGSASDASHVQSLHAADITHILTVDSTEPKDLHLSFQKTFIHLLDDYSADLLSCLPECLQFLKDALEKPGSCVLVHCHAGVSRSAAVIAAYMMNTTKCTFEEAYQRLQDKKTDIKIHEEFVNQLAVFEEMGCDVDISSASYKQYRLQKLTQKYPELQKMPRDVFASDPASLGQSKDIIFRCRKCSYFFCFKQVNTLGGFNALDRERIWHLFEGDLSPLTLYDTSLKSDMFGKNMGVQNCLFGRKVQEFTDYVSRRICGLRLGAQCSMGALNDNFM